jgi:hypothetical protein
MPDGGLSVCGIWYVVSIPGLIIVSIPGVPQQRDSSSGNTVRNTLSAGYFHTIPNDLTWYAFCGDNPEGHLKALGRVSIVPTSNSYMFRLGRHISLQRAASINSAQLALSKYLCSPNNTSSLRWLKTVTLVVRPLKTVRSLFWEIDNLKGRVQSVSGMHFL